MSHRLRLYATACAALAVGLFLAGGATADAPPQPVIDSGPSNPSNQSTASFAFHINPPNATATFRCQLDGLGFSSCSSPRSYSALGDGSHTFQVKAVNEEGESAVASFPWTIDTERPPKPSIHSGPANPTTSTSARFVFSDSEGGVNFQCRLDGGSFSGCSSPKTYSSVAVGTHSFRVRAKDAAGNTGPTASYGWKVVQPQAPPPPPPPPPAPDKTAPNDVSGLRRDVGYKKLQITWHRPPDKDFDHVRVLIATARKGAKSVPRKAVYAGKGSHYTNRHFKSGQYYLYRIVSYDHAGNQSRGTDVVVPPSILLSAPRDGGTIHKRLRLVWAGVPKATFYNVQLYRNGTKILSRWPRVSKLRLARHWSYSGRHYRLKKGKYEWFVWPGFGPRTKGRYGRLLGRATFTVG